MVTGGALTNEIKNREKLINQLKKPGDQNKNTAAISVTTTNPTPPTEALPPVQKIINIERGSQAQEQAIMEAVARANTQHEKERSWLDTEARRLKAELQALKGGQPSVNSSIKDQEIKRLQSESESMQLQNTKLLRERQNLELALAKLRKEKSQTSTSGAQLVKPAKPLFAASSDSLGEQERKLFSTLGKIDSLNQADLDQKYEEIERDLGSISRGRISFSSGDSTISSEEQEKIAEISSKYRDSSSFLVVGFADISGSNKTNRKLSSARAQAVSLQLATKLPPSKIQSIYFGQTKRFGPKSQNRVVEIWEVRSQ